MEYLLVKVFQRYQLNFTAILCLKKSICESAFREDIVVIVVTFPETRCILLIFSTINSSIRAVSICAEL